LLTSENWNNNLYDALNANVSNILSTIYLVSWIWIGNFMLLNLVLSILLDAFSEEDEEERELEEGGKKSKFEDLEGD